MRYLPHTREEIAEMLAVVGKGSLDELFGSIPPECRFDGEIPIPAGLSEWQLNDLVRQIAASMAVGPDHCVLVGAGRYHHHIPETIPALIGRSEFLTAYTPYQPEIAQGTLQGIFEYQTLTARLLGMDVANASLYDGGSALAEALLMGLQGREERPPGGGLRRRPPPLPGRGQVLSAVDRLRAGRTPLRAGRQDRFLLAGRDDRPGGGGRPVAQLLWRDRGSGRGGSGHPRRGSPVRQLFHRTPGLRADEKSGPVRGRHRLRRGPEPRHAASPSAGRPWACSPAARSISATCRDAWSAKPSISRAGAVSSSPFPPVSSISAGKRRPRTSVRTRASAP